MRSCLGLSIAAFCCALASLLGAAPAGAATTYAPTRFDDPLVPAKTCTPPAPANGCSLRGAIEAAQTGDTVQLAAGTYKLERGELKLPKAITIVGAGPGATTIQQTGLSRVIEIENSAGLTMSGVTITGGHLIGTEGADGVSAGEHGGEGGAVYGAGIDASGPLNLTDVVITGNQEYAGTGGAGHAGTSGAGGVGGRGGYADGAGIDGGNPVVLVRVAITDNLAYAGDGGPGGAGGTNGVGGAGGAAGEAGGAGLALGSSTLTATDTLFAGNQGHSGNGGAGGAGGSSSGAGGKGGNGEPSNGGALFSNGTVNLTNVTFNANSAGGSSGGHGGQAKSLTTPTAGGEGGWGDGGDGGAIALMNGAVGQFASVTIDGNAATTGTPGAGGAGSDGGATGSTGPTSGTQGGNIFVYDAKLTLRDTIVAAGQAEASNSNCTVAGGTGSLTSAGHNLEDHHQCIAAPASGDLRDTPAGLGPLQDNGGPTQTMGLLSGSAAIGSGEAACVDALGKPLATDQRGLPRYSPCDIGAFQVQPPAPATPTPPVAVVTLTQLRLAPGELRSGRKAAISFVLSAGAKVTFSLQRKLPGVKVGGACRAPSAHRPGKRCPRWVGAKGGPSAVDGSTGANRVSWVPRHLPPGPYRLVATPSGGSAAAAQFTVLAKSASRH